MDHLNAETGAWTLTSLKSNLRCAKLGPRHQAKTSYSAGSNTPVTYHFDSLGVMKNIGLGPKILAMLSFLLNGCGQAPNLFKQPPDTDVSSLPEYNFSAFAGTVWKTKVKVALADIKAYTGRHEITLIPPQSYDRTHPEYRPPPYMEEIKALLPVGTGLRIERLMKDNGNWGGVQVIASLKDGKVVYLSDYLLAKNRFIWQGWSDSTEWGVDPAMLEK
ncbi:MAG: hypothetical protein ACJ8FY_07945 [Gemmataceae bacterium]